jgi:hypothetical protein
MQRKVQYSEFYKTFKELTILWKLIQEIVRKHFNTNMLILYYENGTENKLRKDKWKNSVDKYN